MNNPEEAVDNDYMHNCTGCGRAAPECECDDNEECPECGYYNCRCGREDDDDWGGAHLDGAIVTPSRWFLADWVRDMRGGVGNVNAIARRGNPHGVGLGGYPWQKRANKRRAMQRDRKHGWGKWENDRSLPW